MNTQVDLIVLANAESFSAIRKGASEGLCFVMKVTVLNKAGLASEIFPATLVLTLELCGQFVSGSFS